jgi:PmbA protein
MMMNEFLPKGASYELYTERKKSSNVWYRGNLFERIDSADLVSQTVRVLHEGKISKAGSSRPDSGEELIKQAAEMVRYGSPYDEEFAKEAEIAPLTLADESTLSAKQMIDMMGGFVEDLRSLDDRLVVSAWIGSTFSDISLKTSGGFDHSYRKSVWSCGGFVELVQGDDLLNLYEYEGTMAPDFDLGKMKETISKKLEYAKNVVTMDAGAYPVIFSPGEVSFVINPVVASLNGMSVYRQISPWCDKLGQELLDKRFTLIDDGSLDKSWTSKPFDIEGTPTRRNTMVQNGRLGDLIMDRKVAAQLGKESSGNAGPTGPAPHYLQLDAGSKTLEELIGSIDRGLLIDGTMGAWSGNPYGGIVSGTISMGLKIEKGKIVGRVKDCMFTIDAFEHFQKHLIDCSTEREQAEAMFGSASLLPYVMLDEVVISAK